MVGLKGFSVGLKGFTVGFRVFRVGECVVQFVFKGFVIFYADLAFIHFIAIQLDVLVVGSSLMIMII